MFIVNTAVNGVRYLTSDMLSCRHGFALRHSGLSREAHTASLNLAFGRGDPDGVVIENLKLFADAIGIDPRSVVSRPQIHSKTVVYADGSMRGEGYFIRTDAGCDGYVTDIPGVALGVKTADCVPILMQDPEAGVIGAVHAGWRGTAAGIAAECVRMMCLRGASPAGIRAAIGPAIHFCCYEVGKDMLEAVSALVGAETAGRFIKYSGECQHADSQHADILHADIVGLNRSILLDSGVSDKHIDVSDFCTCHNPELFFSHRFSAGKRGTMLSVISL